MVCLREDFDLEILWDFTRFNLLTWSFGLYFGCWEIGVEIEQIGEKREHLCGKKINTFI